MNLFQLKAHIFDSMKSMNEADLNYVEDQKESVQSKVDIVILIEERQTEEHQDEECIRELGGGV